MAETKKSKFSKAQRRAYKEAIRDIRSMEEGKQVGKNKITLTPAIVRGRIKKALLEVEGVKEKTAVDWANRIFQRIENYNRNRRNFMWAKHLYEKVSQTHREKTKEQIDEIFETVYRRAMAPTTAKPLKPEFSSEVERVKAARKAERQKLVAQNKHMRVGDHMKKKSYA